MKDDVDDDVAEVGDLILTIPDIAWTASKMNSLAPIGRITSQTVDCKRQCSSSPFEGSFAF